MVQISIPCLGHKINHSHNRLGKNKRKKRTFFFLLFSKDLTKFEIPNGLRKHQKSNILKRTMPSTLGKKFGVAVVGLPVTEKFDKLRGFLTSEKTSVRLWGEVWPREVILFSQKWKETTGVAVFLFEEGVCLDGRGDAINGSRLDKKHTIFLKEGKNYVQVCSSCSCPLDQKPWGGCKPSGVDSNSCEKCLPSPYICCCCLSEFPRTEEYDEDCFEPDLYACDTCQRDRSKQEEWRNTVCADVKDTESSYVVNLYLSDEAIEIEKEIMGGEPRKPLEEDTPFMYSYMIEELINPKSNHYWPYGMSAHEYLEYRQKKWFDNPMEETTSGEWEDIDVTKEIIEDYWKRMTDLQEKYGFKSLKDPGDLPTILEKDGHKYTLFPDIHGATCDNVTCRAINNLQGDLDGGGYAALVLTGLPLYTTRKGDLSKGNARDAGYGHEYCLACIMKD